MIKQDYLNSEENFRANLGSMIRKSHSYPPRCVFWLDSFSHHDRVH